jgi:hypothetical protein
MTQAAAACSAGQPKRGQLPWFTYEVADLITIAAGLLDVGAGVAAYLTLDMFGLPPGPQNTADF